MIRSIPERLWYSAWLMVVVSVGIVVFARGAMHQHDPIVETLLADEFPVATTETPQSLWPPLLQGLRSPYCALASIERTVRLPDLRSAMVCQMARERPDISLQSHMMKVSFRGGGTYKVAAGEKVFVRFEGGRWSVVATPTALSLTFFPKEGGVEVVQELKEGSRCIVAPEELHRFSLSMSPIVAPSSPWEVDGAVVQPSFLEDHGAQWCGKDLVLEVFGGAAYESEQLCERVQFSDPAYALLMKEGDSFILVDHRWERVPLGEQSRGHVLMVVQRIEERQMVCDLWSSDGTGHCSCVLRKKQAPDLVIPSVAIVGARSQHLWIAEIEKKRLIICPTEWILVEKDSVVPVRTELELDAYIAGMKQGSLVAFTGISFVEGTSCLVGHVIDCSRTKKAKITLPLYKAIKPITSPQGEQEPCEQLEKDEEETDDGAVTE